MSQRMNRRRGAWRIRFGVAGQRRRNHRLWRGWRLAADEGAVTAEFAVVLPAVILVAVVLIALARTVTVSMSCQDAAAVAVHKALGGVIIKACVQLMEFAQGAVPAPVTVDGKPAAAVDILALDALGGHRQIPLPVQTEQVRALPHVAEGLRGPYLK